MKWSEEIKKLAHIAQTQPHAAYCTFTHGLSSRWTFLLRTSSDIADLLNPLEEAIQLYLIPALTGRPPCSSVERELLALPVRLGGMGIINPASNSHSIFDASTRLTSPLVTAITTQDQDRLMDIFEVMEAKGSIRQSNHGHQTQQAESIYSRLSPQLKRHVDLAKEKGASSWLSVLPLDDLSTKVRSKMQFVCITAGRCQTLQSSAAVAQLSQLIMPLFVLWVASQQFDTTNCEM